MDEATRRSMFARKLVMLTELVFWVAFELQHHDAERRRNHETPIWSPEALERLVADWQRIIAGQGAGPRQVAAAALAALPIEPMYRSSQRAASFVNFLVYLALRSGGALPALPTRTPEFAGLLAQLGRQAFEARSRVDARMSADAGVFLQIGANDADGADDQAFRRIHEHRDWRKILVEPVPVAVEALRRKVGSLPDVTIVDAAVSDSAGSRTMAVFPDSRLSTLDARLASTTRDGARGTPVAIRCVDGPALFAEAGIDRVDVLVCDTEGHDRIVLEQVMSEATPGAIILEFGHLSVVDQSAVVDLLEQRGYAWCWAPVSLDLYAVAPAPR